MENVCDVCGSKLTLKDRILGSRIKDGRACRLCRREFPSALKMENFYSGFIKEISDSTKKLSEKFITTSRMGCLYLDETNLLIAYSTAGEKGIKTQHTVFDVCKISKLDLSISEPVVKGNTAVCRIVFAIEEKDSGISFSHTVRKNIRCKIKRENDRCKIEYPSEFLIMRSLLTGMLERYKNGLVKELERIIMVEREIGKHKLSLSEKEKERARLILFLDEGYSPEDVKRNYRQLMRVMHPDMNQSLPKEYSEKLNWAYEVLTK